MKGKGIFTISLDFELYWGVRDHRTLNDYGDNIQNVHSIVPRLLELFQKYEVHCTWATVGFLFFSGKEELVNNLPDEKPSYQNKCYDPYDHIQKSELEPKYHFAPSLIEQISKTPGQEIGTHTFSHFYTLEKNTSLNEFRNDLKCAIETAGKRGYELRSIIFPRNQYSDEHIKVCYEEGVKVFRGNLEAGAYKPRAREDESLFKRATRFIDSYINITGDHCHSAPAAGGIINIPASRFLRPHNPGMSWLDGLKFRRIKSGLKFAADKGLIYHLWWHPHNFGKFTDENFIFLESILKVYKLLNLEGKMASQNLIEIYSSIASNAANETSTVSQGL